MIGAGGLAARLFAYGTPVKENASAQSPPEKLARFPRPLFQGSTLSDTPPGAVRAFGPPSAFGKCGLRSRCCESRLLHKQEGRQAGARPQPPEATTARDCPHCDFAAIARCARLRCGRRGTPGGGRGRLCRSLGSGACPVFTSRADPWRCRQGRLGETAMRQLLILAIRIYQKVSRLTPPVCRFRPTCSEYAVQALQQYGVLTGGWLAIRRICRCHPWNPGGYDPVPAPNLAVGAARTGGACNSGQKER